MKLKNLCPLFLALSLNVVHADTTYYQNTAQMILDLLQNRAAQLTPNEVIALALLNAQPDRPTISDANLAAETLLASSFSSAFQQPDYIDFSGYQAGTPFEEPRDVYTFCPADSDVKRPISVTLSIETGDPEYVWGWSYCATGSVPVSGAIRIQQIWVSNTKQPLLTLLMREDGQPGEMTNLNIDINQLVSGNVSVSQILNAISPTN